MTFPFTVRIIVLSVDPYGSTGKLGTLGYNVVFWFAWLSAVWAVTFIMGAWISVADANINGISPTSSKRMARVLYVMAPIMSAGLIFIAFASPYTGVSSPLMTIVVIVFIILAPVLVVYCTVFIYFGVLLLISLRKILFDGNDLKVRMVKNTTALMLSIVTAALCLVVELLVVSVVASTNHTIAEEPPYILGTNICYDLILLDILSTIFFVMTFRGFGSASRSVTSKKDSEGDKRKEGDLELATK